MERWHTDTTPTFSLLGSLLGNSSSIQSKSLDLLFLTAHSWSIRLKGQWVFVPVIFQSSVCCCKIWEERTFYSSTCWRILCIGFSSKFQPLMRCPIVYIADLPHIFFRRQVTSGGSWGYFCYTEGAVIQISASYTQFWKKTTKSNQGHLRICILIETKWWQS